ncbi:branched-chain amino acid ABC transporter substrate-binding protein [Streptomyces sp. GC420]|uniref:branched-chain amino acid ABC transporter substrate-binding protein n=1 Tax=Streptomyces sp. GC420 TaxID=2697568 RepID=UPI0014151E31|nr:branched-chain amino acid ABC transporter substrate-binding protein [Streptomyces sp. GC420]NBM18406.1 ABC transporter substrate-binding protein [Streptomyces sp. GC420]
MHNRSLTAVTALLVAAALSLTACGTDSGGAGNTVVTIGVDVPMTGDVAGLGLGLRNAVDLAVRQANKTNEVPGITFRMKAWDDEARPDLGRKNAGEIVADEDVIGVVGPLNSSVAEKTQDVFADAGMVQVSINRNTALSQGKNWAKGEKVRPYKTYFRTATTDAVQGPFAAWYLYDEGRKRKVFVVDDGKAYGASLAMSFTEEFKEIGGQVVGTAKVNPNAKDFSSAVAKIVTSGADAVYFGGEYPVAGPLSKQMEQAGVSAPLVSGDAVYSDEYIRLAGAASEGDLVTSVGAPVEDLTFAKDFIEDYEEAGYGEPYGVFGGFGYDCAWAIIQAVKAVADGGELPSGARAKVTEAMQDVSFFGVMGTVAFDEYGDTTNKQLTVFEVVDGAWKSRRTGTYDG